MNGRQHRTARADSPDQDVVAELEQVGLRAAEHVEARNMRGWGDVVMQKVPTGGNVTKRTYQPDLSPQALEADIRHDIGGTKVHLRRIMEQARITMVVLNTQFITTQNANEPLPARLLEGKNRQAFQASLTWYCRKLNQELGAALELSSALLGSVESIPTEE